MKLFWTGTDSLMLVDYSMRKLSKRPYWFVFRILVRMIEPFIECHYCNSDNIADNLLKFGMKKNIKMYHSELNYPEKFDKIKHDGFNVIYYNPHFRPDKEFTTWLYGLDIIEQIKKELPEVNFIELDGSRDMSEVYPITDFMLRPNRHDGLSRMKRECNIQNIPYYWTWRNPDIDEAINKIRHEINKKLMLTY